MKSMSVVVLCILFAVQTVFAVPALSSSTDCSDDLAAVQEMDSQSCCDDPEEEQPQDTEEVPEDCSHSGDCGNKRLCCCSSILVTHTPVCTRYISFDALQIMKIKPINVVRSPGYLDQLEHPPRFETVA